MARQRTPDAQKRIRPFAGVEEPEVDGGVKGWLLARRKMLVALLGVPISFLFLKLGVSDLIGVELSHELEVGIASLALAALVERIPNKRARR